MKALKANLTAEDAEARRGRLKLGKIFRHSGHHAHGVMSRNPKLQHTFSISGKSHNAEFLSNAYQQTNYLIQVLTAVPATAPKRRRFLPALSLSKSGPLRYCF